MSISHAARQRANTLLQATPASLDALSDWINEWADLWDSLHEIGKISSCAHKAVRHVSRIRRTCPEQAAALPANSQLPAPDPVWGFKEEAACEVLTRIRDALPVAASELSETAVDQVGDDSETNEADETPELKDLHINCLKALRALRAKSPKTRKKADIVAAKIDQHYSGRNIKGAMADLSSWDLVDSLPHRPPKGMPGGSFITKAGLDCLKTEERKGKKG